MDKPYYSQVIDLIRLPLPESIKRKRAKELRTEALDHYSERIRDFVQTLPYEDLPFALPLLRSTVELLDADLKERYPVRWETAQTIYAHIDCELCVLPADMMEDEE